MVGYTFEAIEASCYLVCRYLPEEAADEVRPLEASREIPKIWPFHLDFN